MPKANRKYKDSVFTMYFSNTERLIELYNSLEGTNLPKDTPIEINTLDDALFKDRINDISFVVNLTPLNCKQFSGGFSSP